LLLNEIGLGDERLLSLHLPGSAKQDLALIAGKKVMAPDGDLLNIQIASVRDTVMETLRSCPPNPLQASVEQDGSSSVHLAAGGSEA
jgi:hypothetical protein